MSTDDEIRRLFGGAWAQYEQPGADAERGPLMRLAPPGYDPVWMVTGYRECVTVLADPVFRRRPATPGEHRIPESSGLELLSGIDPPRHTRLRGFVARAFAARRVEGMRPVLEDLAARHLAGIELDAGTDVDLYRRFCLPLAEEATCAVTGLPPRFRASSTDRAHRMLAQAGPTSPEFARLSAEHAESAVAVIAAKRRSPGYDVLTALIDQRDRVRSITEAELVSMVASLPVTGHVLGAMQLAGMLLVLLNRPRDLDRLRRDPGLIPAAVEELLRCAPVPSCLLPRFPAGDVELGGIPIRAGEAVIPAVFAACRDPAVFADPGRVRLERSGERSLVFGHGAHFCLGAHLMRLMMIIALEKAVEPLAARRVAAPVGGVSWTTGGIAHGVTGLPATTPAHVTPGACARGPRTMSAGDGQKGGETDVPFRELDRRGPRQG